MTQALQTNQVEKLFSKFDWTLAQVNSAPAIGQDIGNGQFNSSSASLGLFDLRAYKSAKVFLYSAGHTGSITPRVFAFDQDTVPAGNYWPLSFTSKAIPAGGGGQTIIMTDSIAPQIISAGVNFDTDIAIIPKPQFCLLYLLPATLTVLATGNLRTAFYAERA